MGKGRGDEDGEDHACRERGDGEDQEGVRAHTSGFFPCFIYFSRGEVWVRGEIGVYVQLADVGCLVE